ncbi:hypothetical protein ZWY2020_046257 [Hordeum vulgare]|nr:hypothetical protein ZWY2020_046257 [Hordeum vulgare]
MPWPYVFQDCLIYIRRPPTGKDAAQARDDHFVRSGFVLSRTAPSWRHPRIYSLDGVLTYLGRPWMDHATVVFMLCSIDDTVHADGWVVWDPSRAT